MIVFAMRYGWDCVRWLLLLLLLLLQLRLRLQLLLILLLGVCTAVKGNVLGNPTRLSCQPVRKTPCVILSDVIQTAVNIHHIASCSQIFFLQFNVRKLIKTREYTFYLNLTHMQNPNASMHAFYIGQKRVARIEFSAQKVGENRVAKIKCIISICAMQFQIHFHDLQSHYKHFRCISFSFLIALSSKNMANVKHSQTFEPLSTKITESNIGNSENVAEKQIREIHYKCICLAFAYAHKHTHTRARFSLLVVCFFCVCCCCCCYSKYISETLLLLYVQYFCSPRFKAQ